MWGLALTIFGLIITVAAIALGFSAKNRAVTEAKQAANTASESHMEKWLLDNKDKLITDTKSELKNVSLELKNRAEKLEAEARAALEKIKQEQQQAWDALLAENKDVVTSKRNKEDNTATKHNKPKVYQTAQEWFKAGINAFANSEYDEALNAWNKVLGLVDSEQESKLYAITMGNQGVTYGRLDKLNEELYSYSTLIEQFKDSSNEEIQIQVAKAMCNQGITYGQQGKFDDALNSFITLIEQFKGSSNEEIQKTIANSRANIAEQALVYETPEQVLIYVAEVEKYSDNPQYLAVMQFIRFLLDDKTIEEVFTALTKIPTEMKLTWSFREIKDYLTDNFEGIKQQQIQAVVQYFEQHTDIEQLGVELGIKG
jgi:tetratricopeptide (TPR) repeat protein